MGTDPRPGPAAVEGLRWLSRVGPAPLEAWRHAMGWGPTMAWRHARRLEDEQWLERHRMTRGDGSLFLATRRGVRVCGVDVTACAAPAATWWAHDCACAWTAAWLTARNADWHGPREVLRDQSLSGKLEWQTRSGWRRATHRPDLTLTIPAGQVAIEVELQRKADKRLDAILAMYRRWLGESRVAGVVYVCGSQSLADRIRNHAVAAGVPSRATRIELLDSVRTEARELAA